MTNIIISGIGGQGTVSLGHILSKALNDNEIKFVASETHGMSQRGGSVVFHLKIGDDAISPLIEKGNADMIVAGEPMEALRVVEFLKPDGIIVTATHTILSPVAKQMGMEYPDVEDIYDYLKQWPADLFTVDTTKISEEIGNKKVGNIILLGLLIKLGLIPFDLDEMKSVVKKRWPRFYEDNFTALDRGYELEISREQVSPSASIT